MLRAIAFFVAGLAVSASALVMPARAGTPLASVVELFTSQGCSSCPPADMVLDRLADDGTVLALGWHVDYWDYLGWRDTLGLPDATMRQKAYAMVLDNERRVYTPQAVINGRLGVIGSHAGDIADVLGNGTAGGLVVQPQLTAAGDRLSIALPHTALPSPETALELVYFVQHADVAIERGENAGRTVSYRNAVRGIDHLGMWDGTARVLDVPRMMMDDLHADGCAVLVRAITAGGKPGAIIGAALLE